MRDSMSQEGAALGGLRVVFFGMGGVFSRAPLEALLQAGADVRAVVEPAPAELRAAGDEPLTRLGRAARCGAGCRWRALAAGRAAACERSRRQRARRSIACGGWRMSGRWRRWR